MTGRLMVRLTRRCNSACAHCTIADLPDLPDRDARETALELQQARRRGCDAVVFMRGEATLRPELPRLAELARRLGYRTIQLQTNGRMLGYANYLERLLSAGMNFFEVSLFGPTAELHDMLSADAGAFDQTLLGLEGIVAASAAHMVTVPILRANLEHLEATVERLARMGVAQVQFGFTRPVRVDGEYPSDLLVRLDEAGPKVRAATARARELGLLTSTEAVPLCHLDPADWPGAERPEFFVDVRVTDLHRRHESFADHQRQNRPQGERCGVCSLAPRCSTTWAAYQQLHGSDELRAVAGDPPTKLVD